MTHPPQRLAIYRVTQGGQWWIVEAFSSLGAMVLLAERLSGNIREYRSRWNDEPKLTVELVGVVGVRATSPEQEAIRELEALLS